MKNENFFKRFPILTNLLLVAILFLLIIFGVQRWLHKYTQHDYSVEIPNEVINMPLEKAADIFAQKKLRFEVTDSIYVKKAKPGTIQKTIPSEGSKIKEGRIVYLTTYAYSPPMVMIPDIIDMSQRRALALLKSTGFENIKTKEVDGAYQDLVVGIETGGNEVLAGSKYHVNTPLTLLISSGKYMPDFIDPLTGDSLAPMQINTEEGENWF
ncbi:PASTA domain-containing protein [Bacteroidales bacterium OttesenSCG-928-I14]|nr:PASTA domain-containing protein [Bacteroidales bacterium OttesenSCG-928-I14]